MEATRDHLGGAMEVGYADVMQPHQEKAPAHHAAPPRWLMNWEDKRPRLLVEMFAEALGVFIYVYCGVGASAAFFVTSALQVAGFGSLLTVGFRCVKQAPLWVQKLGFSYGFGIILAIVVCGPASGGHLSPCYTLAFWLFKGFPAKKVPFYIAAQIFGAFLGALVVYGVYKQQLVEITAALEAAGEAAAIFTPQGPAGVFALAINTGQDLSYVFLNEFLANIFLSIAVFAVLDSSNVFVQFASAPFLIGLAYMVMIWAFAADSIALNTARDLGGRFAAACFWGSKGAFPAKYTALATLTNIFATLVGAAIQTLLLSDSARPTVTKLPDPDGPSLRAVTRDATSMRAISREEKGSKDSHLE